MLDFKYTYPFLKDATIAASNECYLESHSLCMAHYTDCYGIPYKTLTRNTFNITGGGLDILDTYPNKGIGSLYDYDKDIACEVNENVVFLGYICSTCWGHTITDSLARLWWISKENYSIMYKDALLYYYSEKPLTDNYIILLQLLGVKTENLRYVDSVVHFSSVVVPEPCFINTTTSLRFTKEYVSLIDKLIANCHSTKSYNKIFLSKEDSVRQITSMEIKNILLEEGFTIVYPEKLSVQEQISIMQNAETIVSEESSLSHNFIFCHTNTKVVILRKANTINVYQALINQIRALNVVYIDCHLSVLINPLHPHRGPFFLYANDYFCRYFNKKTLAFPFDEFYTYLQNGVTEDEKWDTLYKDILNNIISQNRINKYRMGRS